MDKKNIKIIASVGFCIIGLAIFLFTSNKKPDDTKIPPDDNTSNSQAELLPENNDNLQKEDIAISGLEELKPEDDTVVLPDIGLDSSLSNQQISIEDAQKEALEAVREVKPLLNENGEQQYTFTGHKIYVGTLNYKMYDIEANSVIHFIISGMRIIPIGTTDNHNMLQYEKNLFNNLCTEDGKRIYVFDTQEDIDKENQKWQAGQDILSGKTPAEKGQVIFDGKLIPDAKWKKHRRTNNVAIPLCNIIDSMNNGSRIEEWTKGYYLFTNGYEGIEYERLFLHENSSRDLKTLLDYKGETFVIDGYYDENEEMTRFPVLYGKEGYCDAEMLMETCGWKISTNGDIVIIETDPSNVTNNFILNENKDGVHELTIDDLSEDTVNEIFASDTSSENTVQEKSSEKE